ncbi:MAG: hypothetical protein K8T90_00885 [Planctomycetes bacterium]|nr:hypothetical protein [Planctomycetota bacterium]
MPWEYVLPAGLVRTGPAEPLIGEAYEVQWRDDEDPPHYFFWVQAGALRLERFIEEAFRLLPVRVQVVLELRRSDDDLVAELSADATADATLDDPDDDRTAEPGAPPQVRWISAVVSRDRLLRVWKEHGPALVHDGMTGFGAYDPDSVLEVFMDDHKLVSLFASDPAPVEELLRRHGIQEGRAFPTILDAEHEHLPLSVVRTADPQARRAWGRRRALDVEVFAPAIQAALGMRRQDLTFDAEHADDEAE